MKTFCALLVMVVFVFGCASTRYRERCQEWVGKSADNLTRGWGVPRATYELRDGSRLLEYLEEGPAETTAGHEAWSGRKTLVTSQSSCKTTFEVSKGGFVTGFRVVGRCRRGLLQ